MPSDPRKENITSYCATHFGPDTKIPDNQALNDFLDDANCSILSVTQREGKGNLELSNKVSFSPQRFSHLLAYCRCKLNVD